MEGFELINTGILSIVPPVLALVLALVTKEVYSSLTIGVFTGMLIYVFSLEGPGLSQLIDAFCMMPQMMAEQIASNGALIYDSRAGVVFGRSLPAHDRYRRLRKQSPE